MGKFSKHANKINEYAKSVFGEYAAAEAKYNAAKQKYKSARRPEKNTDYAAIASYARIEADYKEAQAEYDSIKAALHNKPSEFNALRREFEAAVNNEYAAKPEAMDLATITLMDSGILKPNEYLNLLDKAEKAGNYTMMRMIGAKAEEMVSKAPDSETARTYRVISTKGKRANGSEYIEAISGLSYLFDRCMKNTALQSKWDELAGPVLDQF